MSTYTPVVVTASNYRHAIRENFRRINECLKTKLHVSQHRPFRATLDADNHTLTNVSDSTHPQAAATYGQLLHFSLSAILLVEDGDALTTVEDATSADEIALY